MHSVIQIYEFYLKVRIMRRMTQAVILTVFSQKRY